LSAATKTSVYFKFVTDRNLHFLLDNMLFSI